MSASYRFGSTRGGALQTHHGVDIGNPVGAPIVAVGAGTIVWAGPDTERLFGPHADFYGNVVVLQMAEPWDGHSVFELYGHLNDVTVQTGQPVGEGEALGHVGETGIALGPHLHFEVRLDDPGSYWSVYNPELWLRPVSGYGALAIRLVDAAGRYLPGVRVSLTCSDGLYRFVDTYWDNGVQPDPGWGENAAIGNLPPGTCDVETRVFGETLRQSVLVGAGQTAFVLLASGQ